MLCWGNNFLNISLDFKENIEITMTGKVKEAYLLKVKCSQESYLKD